MGFHFKVIAIEIGKLKFESRGHVAYLYLLFCTSCAVL